MAQIPEIPASAYTPEMETLGVIPDIPVFEGDQIPMSHNALTSDTQPLQFLPASGSDFPIRYNTDAMRGFQSEVDLSEARAGGSSTDASTSRTFRNQVSSFVQSLPNDLWGIHPMNQLAWLKYSKDLKPDHGFLSWLVRHFNPNTMVFRCEDFEVTPTYEEMCAVMGHHPEHYESPALPPGPRYDLTEVVALCPVYLPGGIDPDQGLPLEPFLNRVLSMDANPSWVRACCFLLLNMYAMKNCRPRIGDF
ncbi:hypothetical protein JCGZ_05227 [Jatropha curcas]|uniref:Aminotransferase-like plant mobile domain-containing protein n=1 Tax=Jatropha curcas TaxID=180498 RepID=A0A067KNR4_JATCU|nr:hypothetical protein JCGZ_05227 [Jatropha curcas]